jgi:hypothetical protein
MIGFTGTPIFVGFGTLIKFHLEKTNCSSFVPTLAKINKVFAL